MAMLRPPSHTNHADCPRLNRAATNLDALAFELFFQRV